MLLEISDILLLLIWYEQKFIVTVCRVVIPHVKWGLGGMGAWTASL